MPTNPPPDRVTLAELKPGDRARIHTIAPGEDRALRLRLLEMGLVPGTSLAVERRAPLGDPLEVRVRGYALTIRRTEAQLIHVEAHGD